MYKFFTIILLFTSLLKAQGISQKLDTEVKKLLNSEAMLAGNLSFYVTDDTGKPIYDYQGNKGLATASTQKILTAIAALDILGKDFQFTTRASYSGSINNNQLNGNLFLTSDGDPTLGSWRYEGYKPKDFLDKLVSAVQQKGITRINGNIILDDSYFDMQSVPGGWPWNDMGNYYGAGTWGICWNENQFDINIIGGKEGTGTTFKDFNFGSENVQWFNDTTAKGNSDRSIIYTAPFSETAIINGTLPTSKAITVSGAMPNPPLVLGKDLEKAFAKSGIEFSGKIITTNLQRVKQETPSYFPKENQFFEYKSPALEKIIFYFLRKSVNLYGETFIKTLGKKKNNDSHFSSGLKVLKDYWKGKGIPSQLINFADGSGLSPQNYVAAKAEVMALLYAEKQPWYNIFYEALPTYNAMKMKSGTIKDSKGFTGYHQSKDGNRYVFSMLINNYSGNDVSSAMFKVLDVLK